MNTQRSRARVRGQWTQSRITGRFRGSLASLGRCRLAGTSGMTIIEMVMVIVVLAIAIPPLLNMFSEVGINSVQAEFQNTASLIGQSYMEEIISKKFDETLVNDPLASAPWSDPLGSDGGESRSSYDDVDDFDGYTEDPVANYTGFSTSVTVYYVDPDSSDLDTVQPDSSSSLDYKRIDVTVTHSQVGSMSFSLIKSSQRP